MKSSRQTGCILLSKARKQLHQRLKVLLTNDDGIDGEGMLALEKALRNVADVYVLAPDGNRSAVSSHIIMHKPLSMVSCGERRWASGGNPVDCVITGLRSDIFGVDFDVVISGINKGANMGTDIVYSGTVAAARQAALYGFPGIAVSLESYDGTWNFEPLADWVASYLRRLVSFCAKGCFVNINAASRESYEGFAFASLSVRDYLDRITVMDAPDRRKYGFFSGGVIQTMGNPDCDFVIVKAGSIAVSLICAEPRAERMTEELAAPLLMDSDDF